MVYTPQGIEKNPRYVTGTKRKVLEFVNDLLPVNQISQLIYGKPGAAPEDSEENSNNAWFPVYSIALILVTSSAGILIFHRKDLK